MTESPLWFTELKKSKDNITYILSGTKDLQERIDYISDTKRRIENAFLESIMERNRLRGDEDGKEKKSD